MSGSNSSDKVKVDLIKIVDPRELNTQLVHSGLIQKAIERDDVGKL